MHLKNNDKNEKRNISTNQYDTKYNWFHSISIQFNQINNVFKINKIKYDEIRRNFHFNSCTYVLTDDGCGQYW